MFEFIDAPYIDFSFVKATPAVVLCIAYFVLLVVACCCGVVKNRIKLHFLLWNTYSEERKRYIIRSMGGFIIGSIVCWIIPPLFDEESLLVRIFKDYLQYEPIIAVGIFLLLCSALLSAKNKDKHIGATNKVLQFVLPVSVGTGLFEGRIDLCFWPNWLVVTFAYIFYFLLLVTDSEPVVDKSMGESRNNDISYNPVEKVEQLFPQHKAQAERIANIIADSSSDPFSICLSGKWGTGKTSVINGVTEVLRKKDKDNYAFIRLNAIELDNKKTLLNYFMSEVKSYLKEKGIYVGIASEYTEFLTSMVGTITTESFGTFFRRRIFGSEKDYRKQKTSLENLLITAFGNGKLVLIVDDIERCQPDVAREYLFLIKEVATMKNCVSIFITDYNVLLKLFEDDANTQTTNTDGKNNEFLDKFFNYRINLYNEDPEDIFAFFDRSFKEDDPIFTSIYKIIGISPGTWYRHTLEEMDLRIEKQEEDNRKYHLSEQDKKAQENKLRGIKEKRETFVQYMENTRCTVKFYNTFRRNMHRCHKQLFGFETREHEKSLVYKFIRERNIGQIVAFLSFVEVCMPDELQQIIKNGADYIEPHFYRKENVPISKERDLLIEIASVTVYGESLKRTNYMTMEIRRFINKFLEPNAELHQLIKPFTTQEEEWLDAIQNENEILVDSNWNRMVRMILEKNPDSNSGVTIQWKKDMFANLLEFAKKKVEQGSWKIDRVFSVFEDDKRGRYFADGMGMLQVFWDYLQNLNITTTLSEESVNNAENFADYFSYYKVTSVCNLFQCIIAYEESGKTKNIKEELLNSTRTLEENLLQFVNKISEYIPDFCPENDGWYEKFQVITKYIRNYLEDKGLLEYEDVNKEVDHMMDSVNELYCLSKILEWIQREANNALKEDLSEKDYSQIDTTIQYFEKMFIKNWEQHLDTDIEKQFSDFFMYLKSSTDIRLNVKQIKQLQDLVTLLVKETGCYSLFYRKVLLHMSTQNDEQTSICYSEECTDVVC